jgi:hypothetical protein
MKYSPLCNLIGVVHESTIEKYLADAVLKAVSKKAAGKS